MSRPMLPDEAAEHLNPNRAGHDWRCRARAPWTENGLPIICTRAKGHDYDHQAASYEGRIVREWEGETTDDTDHAGTTGRKEEQG